MLNLIRDPAWQFLGIIIGLLSLGAAFWIYWAQRQVKELAFGVVSSRRLVSIADEMTSRVTVQWDGKTVKDVHLLVYAVRNSGHRAITSSDFQRPLSLTFPNGKIISAEIPTQIPANLGATLKITPTRLELEPLLLNSGDQILIQVLVSSSAPLGVRR